MLRKTLFILGVCLSLSACQTISGGNSIGGEDKFTPAALSKNLITGVTTSQEVRAMYGTPSSTQEGKNGPSMWVYHPDRGFNELLEQAVSFVPIYGGSTAVDQVKKDRTLYIHFENNRVSDYSLGDYKPK